MVASGEWMHDALEVSAATSADAVANLYSANVILGTELFGLGLGFNFVPEPASVSLFLMGLGLVACRISRKNLKHQGAGWQRGQGSPAHRRQMGRGPVSRLQPRCNKHPLSTQPSQGHTMNKDQIKGTVKETTGKVQTKVGEVTGSTTQQLKGLHKEAAGKAQRLVGDVKEVLKDTSRKA